MNKVILVIISALLLSGCSLKDFFVKPPAGLEIKTTPDSTVFLNGENKGVTPYTNQSLKPGEYLLRLVPVSPDNLSPYELKLNLVSRASTVISRNFFPSDIDSSGYILQLVAENEGTTSLSIISDPDMISATIDGKPSGFTPLSKLSITPGAHSLLVSSPGYISQELSVTTVKGYNLIINFKLASATITLASATPATASSSSPSPSSSPPSSTTPIPSASVGISLAKPYVLIGETETGWLRVRQEASGTSDELGKANTGEKLKYLGESTDLGWHQVEFEGSPGWVSGKYVTVVN